MIRPMSMAMGMVMTTMNKDQGALCMALMQASERPARVRTRMQSTAMPATVPVTGPTSRVAMAARLCPLWRTEANRMTISCTAPPSTQPIRIQSAPGR